jgi:hypothetical protein
MAVKTNTIKNIAETTIISIDDIITRGNPVTIVGGIQLYAGDVSALPMNWHVCNGSNNTPDMTADFKTYGNISVIYVMYTGGN